jgi:hypothetical protein
MRAAFVADQLLYEVDAVQTARVLDTLRDTPQPAANLAWCLR